MMTEPLKLTISFKDATLNTPENKPTLDKLIESAEKILIDHFRASFFKDNEKKPFTYPSGGLDAHLLQLAKKALEQPQSNAYPGDDIQLIIAKIDDMARTSLTSDFGPTTANHLHPVITIT
jgi:hypothetical protein